MSVVLGFKLILTGVLLFGIAGIADSAVRPTPRSGMWWAFQIVGFAALAMIAVGFSAAIWAPWGQA